MVWNHSRLVRRAALLRLVGLAALVAGLVGAGAPRGAAAEAGRPVIDPERVGYPRSLAALGDSITRAFLSVPINFPSEQPSDAPQNSWSSGTEAAVNSHYARIRAAQPLIDGKNNNFARSGAKMGELPGQANQAVAAQSEYVTILMGANDVCAGSEAAMTAVTDFRNQFSAALTELSAGLPDARILVVGIPDIYEVWELSHAKPEAQFVWGFGVCQSMFQNPTSTDAADVQRRERVRQRNIDYNTQLSEVCAQYIHCRYSDVLFTSTLEPADLAQDYYHPSVAGQAKLAAATYADGFNFSDAVAPVSISQVAEAGQDVQITLSASDNVGVAGIEYRLGEGPWLRYQTPLTVAKGSSVIYRAVDVNGNIEASRSIVYAAARIYLPLITKVDPAQQAQASQMIYSAIMRTIVRSLS